MAKNIVKVNEEEIRGYMVGNIPDAIEKEDVIVVEVPAEETDKRPDKEKETASENPEPHPKRKSESGFRPASMLIYISVCGYLSGYFA